MRSTFAESAQTFAELVRQIRPDQWEGPGLGSWSLRSLVGHTSRSLITVENALDQPTDHVDVTSPAGYYAAIRSTLRADPAAVDERGVQAGIALGDDPVGYITALVDRVVPRAESAGELVVTTIAGGMRLRTYLATRTFELVVHGLDLAGAAGLTDPEYSVDTLTEVATIAAATAVLTGQGPELILGLTGRMPLPAGFSVV